MGLIQAVLVSATLLSLLVWATAVAFAPVVAARLNAGAQPASVTLWARAWLYAPLWVPVLALSVTLLVGVVMGHLGLPDHCVRHGGHHHHLCLFHPPHAGSHAFGWIVGLAGFTIVVALLSRAALRVRHDAALAMTLVRSSEPSVIAPDVRLIRSSRPFALAVGNSDGTVLLSEGIAERLSDEELAVVLDHEREHLQRRDAWWAAVDRLAAGLFPAHRVAPLLDVIGLAREQACDAASARDRDPVRVAAVLTRVARMQVQAPIGAHSFGAASLERRVERLLSQEPTPPFRPAVAVAGGLGIATFLSTGPAHHAIETLLAALLH